MADSSAATPQSNSGSKPPCPFLDKLPGELRNDIYELAFSPDHEPDTPVNLIDAKPPQRKALLATCRQVYKEATGIYFEAYRKNWKETKFVIRKEHLYDEKHLWAAMSKFSPADLDNVKHLRIDVRWFWKDSVTQYEHPNNMGIVYFTCLPFPDGDIFFQGLASKPLSQHVPQHLQLIHLIWYLSPGVEVPEKVSIEALYRRWRRLRDYHG